MEALERLRKTRGDVVHGADHEIQRGAGLIVGSPNAIHPDV
jgi:hypothetical protein